MINIADETKLRIFSHLSLPDVMKASQVCKEWRRVLEDRSIWVSFLKLLFTDAKPGEHPKLTFINKVVSLKKETRNENGAACIIAHISLSRIGQRSLEFTEQRLAAISLKIRDPDEINCFYYAIGLEYLKNNFIQEAEKTVVNIASDNLFRGILASLILEKRLEMGCLGKALLAMTYHKRDQLEANRSLCRLIHAAAKADEIDIAFQAIASLQKLRFAAWDVCVKKLACFLDEKGEFQKLEMLKALDPEVYSRDSSFWTVKYYIYTNQLAKAELSVLACPDFRGKWQALNEIEQFYDRSGNQQEKRRIHAVMAQLTTYTA